MLRTIRSARPRVAGASTRIRRRGSPAAVPGRRWKEQSVPGPTEALLTRLDPGAGGDRPDALAVAGRACSREQLLGAAAAVAHRIAGAPAVAVHADASLETVAAVVGGLLAGVPVVPLPPDAGPAERGHILRDSGAALVLGGDDGLPVGIDERGDWSGAEPAPDSTALILYTSGTTGAPKGALIPRSAVAAGLDGLAEAWQWTAEDTLVHGLPLFHVHGLVLGVLGALRTGCRLVHTGRPTPEAYAAAGGSLYFGVPTVWSRVVREPSAARELAGARLLVSGSAALPAPVFRDLEALTGQRPVERYGMTETLITVSARAGGERRPGAVGTPLPGVRTRLVAAEGGIGELEVSGPTLFSGYLGRPEATEAAHTADGWFRTGDIAAIEEDGTHRIVGRASTDLIKSGGYRVGAGEVENALLDHPAVREAAVVGVPHDDLGQEIVAYVVADGATEKQLIDFVAGHLSVHKRPRRVRFLEALPRNAMGKPQKKLLPPL
ncbi:AMP-binding protein [Streptomyces sp. NRRL B-1677]|nr:AMP-binding protein [Streptomyces sp. NRRL B-1677]